jgi:hypothetical protein
MDKQKTQMDKQTNKWTDRFTDQQMDNETIQINGQNGYTRNTD